MLPDGTVIGTPGAAGTNDLPDQSRPLGTAVIGSVVIFEVTPYLRWHRRPAPRSPSLLLLGASAPARKIPEIRVLQQMWACKRTGAVEWRDVPEEAGP
jgi:hypothetical protein